MAKITKEGKRSHDHSISTYTPLLSESGRSGRLSEVCLGKVSNGGIQRFGT